MQAFEYQADWREVGDVDYRRAEIAQYLDKLTFSFLPSLCELRVTACFLGEDTLVCFKSFYGPAFSQLLSPDTSFLSCEDSDLVAGIFYPC